MSALSGWLQQHQIVCHCDGEHRPHAVQSHLWISCGYFPVTQLYPLEIVPGISYQEILCWILAPLGPLGLHWPAQSPPVILHLPLGIQPASSSSPWEPRPVRVIG